jgi:PhoH-like ATPase
MRAKQEFFDFAEPQQHPRKGKGSSRQRRSLPQASSGEAFPFQNSGLFDGVAMLQRRGFLSLEAITYMRGRSIPRQFMFIDEAQNLSAQEVKTIISRAGEGTKVVLSGDPFQIDSPRLDFFSNGLTVTAQRLKDQPLAATVLLEDSERSRLAQMAIKHL